MEDKRGRGRPRQKLLDWMMTEGYRKKLSFEKRGAIGGVWTCQRTENLKKKKNSNAFIWGGGVVCHSWMHLCLCVMSLIWLWLFSVSWFRVANSLVFGLEMPIRVVQTVPIQRTPTAFWSRYEPALRLLYEVQKHLMLACSSILTGWFLGIDSIC